MSVNSQSVGRQDWLLHRNADESRGARWLQDRLDGNGLVPVDLKSWTATLTLSLPDGREVYSLACTTTSDGLAIASIPASAFSTDIWKTRSAGSWRIDATDGSRHELLGHGAWSLCD
jgi:hypothetical protein